MPKWSYNIAEGKNNLFASRDLNESPCIDFTYHIILSLENDNAWNAPETESIFIVLRRQVQSKKMRFKALRYKKA